MAKTPFGMEKTKKVPSPTGRPSKKKPGVKKFEAGDFSGGARPKVKKKSKKKKARSGIPRIERALRDAGA